MPRQPGPTLRRGAHSATAAMPLATLRPARVEELCQTVREQVALGHAIYPQGGRTALDYGGVPRRPGVAIDTTGISRLIDYPFADMTITVEAGMTLSALRAILAEQGQRVLVDAPDPDRATLGGIYATNTSGPRRYAAGRPRDQIIGVSFVTSAGRRGQGRGTGRQERRRLRFSQALDGLDGHARHHHPTDAQGSPDPRGLGDRLGAVLEPEEPGRHARPAQQVRNAASRPRVLERLGRSNRRPGTGLAHRSGHPRHRL